ncbi:MAG: DUF427 domain-containing protein [Acidimicrobiia bacterium]
MWSTENTVPVAAWTYPSPRPGAEDIEEWVAFWGEVNVEGVPRAQVRRSHPATS